MEGSHRTSEEFNLRPGDPAPPRPAPQTGTPEMFTSRKIREESVHRESKSSPREPDGMAPASLHRSPSIQTPTEKPWENVTLNRCLLVAITILVLSSGFQRLNETLRGHRTVEDEEEVALTLRRPNSLRHRQQTLELDDSLWDVLFWWLPDFDDEDDDDEDDDENGELKRRKTKQSRGTGASSGLRNKALPDKELMKHRGTTLKARRARRAQKNKKDEGQEPGEEEEEEVPRNRKKQGKENKSQKG